MAIEDIVGDEVAAQAGFDMANLRPERTGLPFVVFISQRGGARHDSIKLARASKVRPSEMMTVAVRPAPRVIRGELSAAEFDRVRRWSEQNTPALVAYWEGRIEYTEDVLQALKPLTEADRS